MTIRCRNSWAILMVLALVLTAPVMAAARALPMPAPVGFAVICIGAEPRLIAVDATGAPAEPRHFCPDCCAPDAGCCMVATGLPGWQPVQRPVAAMQGSALIAKQREPLAAARGPPVAV